MSLKTLWEVNLKISKYPKNGPFLAVPDEPPAKKVKQEVDPDVLRKTREAKAERLREEMTLEKRTAHFNQLLEEHQIG